MDETRAPTFADQVDTTLAIGDVLDLILTPSMIGKLARAVAGRLVSAYPAARRISPATITVETTTYYEITEVMFPTTADVLVLNVAWHSDTGTSVVMFGSPNVIVETVESDHFAPFVRLSQGNRLALYNTSQSASGSLFATGVVL